MTHPDRFAAVRKGTFRHPLQLTWAIGRRMPCCGVSRVWPCKSSRARQQQVLRKGRRDEATLVNEIQQNGGNMSKQMLAVVVFVAMFTVPTFAQPQDCRNILSSPTTARFDGLIHHAVGGGFLTLAENGAKLAIHNLGSSGSDGVAIDLPKTSKVVTGFDCPNFLTSNPGDRLVYACRGHSTFTIENVANELEANADFSVLGATEYEIQVFGDDGSLITTQTGLSSGSFRMAKPDIIFID